MEDFDDFFIKPLFKKINSLSKFKKVFLGIIFFVFLTISLVLVFSREMPEHLRAPLTIIDWSRNMSDWKWRH